MSVETKHFLLEMLLFQKTMMMILDDAWWVPMRMCRWANQTEDAKCERALVYLGVQSKLLRASYCLVLATCRRCAKKPVSRATEEWPLNESKMGSGWAYPLSGTSLILPWRYFSRVNACCNRLIILSDCLQPCKAHSVTPRPGPMLCASMPSRTSDQCGA